MAAPRLPNELSWPKLFGTALAAVTAAWLAGYLGLGNTLTGAAIGSIVATMATAVFTSTINRGSTILIRTESGTLVQSPVDESGAEADDGDAQPGAHRAGAHADTAVVPSVADADQPWWRRLHWPAIAVATLITLGVTMFGITMYEEAVGRTWGSNQPGTSLGHTFGHGPQPTVAPTETPSSTPTPSKTPTPTPTPTGTATASPSPGGPATTPGPTESPTPAPSDTTTPTPTPTDNALPPG